MLKNILTRCLLYSAFRHIWTKYGDLPLLPLTLRIQHDYKEHRKEKLCNRIKVVSYLQQTFTCSKLSKETLEKGVKYVQS